jgi:hypothetical protein
MAVITVRQCVIAELGAERAVAAVDRHNILLAAGVIRHRRRLPARGKTVLPELFAAVNVERTDESSIVPVMNTTPPAVMIGPLSMGTPS